MHSLMFKFRNVGYSLLLSLLTVSCVLYQRQQYSAQEAVEVDKRIIQVVTKDQQKIKLRWFELEGDTLKSIQKTKKEYIPKEEIDWYMINYPNTQIVSLETALKHPGTIYVRVKEPEGRYRSIRAPYDHQFIRIVEEQDFIIGYRMTGKDTCTVAIPLRDIQQIRVENKGETIAVNTIIGAVGLWALTLFVIMIGYVASVT